MRGWKVIADGKKIAGRKWKGSDGMDLGETLKNSAVYMGAMTTFQGK
jgi:hypothetical protein